MDLELLSLIRSNIEVHFFLELQNGLETVCHGVDVLNTETQEVTVDLPSKLFKFYLASLFKRNLILQPNCLPSNQLYIPGDSIYFKSDLTCFRWSRSYLSINHKSSGILASFAVISI